MADIEPNAPSKAPPTIGSYRLIRPLGSGGMSSVFLAMHLETGHEVAVKVLPRTLARNPTLLQRFLREAKNAESLEHPNIAAIYDRGFDDGRNYLVLEYVAGGDLHERVRGSGPLPVAEAIRVIRSTAEGLDYASGRGVIHRDVKPANLLVTPDGRVKIIDLGLALQAEAEDERVTRDGTTVGTVDYMAPEQARDSRATSERSDIYSLGCTFYFLLTGSPPYPGGNVPDKLGRHCTAPIPDVRELRPEVSQQLADLVRRMMAKRPEARFPDYMSLIAALDALPESDGARGEAMDALIAEDDDGPQPLDALIADEDDEIGLAPVEERTGATPRRPPSRPKAVPKPETSVPPPLEISIAELAALEDETPALRGRSRPVQIEAGDEDGPFALAQTRPIARTTTSGEIPLSTWVAAGAILGLSIALIGFGVFQFFAPTESKGIDAKREGAGGQESAIDRLAPALAPPVVRPPNRPIIVPRTTEVAKSPPAPPWVEPGEPSFVLPAEPTYPAEVEAGSLPDWAKRPVAALGEGPIVTVRRVPEAADSTDVPTLRAALNAGSGSVEIADNGPFFEDDLLDRARARTIRARPGFRPMIVVETSNTALVRDRSSIFSLDGSRLVLEGIDLVVDARSLPQPLSTVFTLKGAELTLLRCTVTIINASQHPLTLIRTDEPGDQRPGRSSNIRVEQSLLRGAEPAVFDVGAAGDVVVLRSLVLGGSEAIVVQRPTSPRDPRRYFFARSLLASRASVLALAGARPSTPARVRALGTTFAKVAGLNGRGVVHVQAGLSGPPSAALEWTGRDDAFVGWPSWLDEGDRTPRPVLADLSAARAEWKGTEPDGREARRAWPIDDLVPIATVASLPESRPAVLARVAEPQPSLIESTVGSFDRIPLPELPRAATAGPGGVSPSGATLVAGVNASIDANRQRPGQPSGGDPQGEGTGLTFDVADPGWHGDLGRFLSQRLGPGTGRAVVKVVGSGTWPMTPVRLPDGVVVSIESTSGTGQGPMWVPKQDSAAPALIESHGGGLMIRGLSFGWSPSSKVGRLILVEDGHLILSDCALKSGELEMPRGSGLILFRAARTRPLETRMGLFASPTDRPVCSLANCLLMCVGGEALAAELGRGVVSLSETAILSEGEGAAISLRPQKVARARFEADLGLDHCSIAAEKTGIALGPWPGANPGPARPWLVTSHRSAYFEVDGKGRRDTVLLRSLGDGLAHGSLAWQADGDGYDLAYFTSSGPADPAPYRQRPDVKALWVDFWGSRHVRNVTGPNPRKDRDGATILTRDRLRPGTLTPDDLRLDSKAHPDLGVDLRRLPSSWSRSVPIPF